MRVHELAEFSALLAMHGPVLIRHGELFPDGCLSGYWAASRARFDRWHRSLKEFASRSQGQPRGVVAPIWFATKPTLEEILVSDMLTRVWATVACVVDRTKGTSEAEPIVRNVLLGQQEVRNRALSLLVFDAGTTMAEGVLMNRLRRRVERWTDMLLGHLALFHDMNEFAFDPQRTKEFSRDIREEALAPNGPGWQLTFAALRATFQSLATSESPNADLNGRIISSLMLCFQSELFDSTGLFRTVWLERIALAANDSQGMIDELLALDEAPVQVAEQTLDSSSRRWM